MSAGVLAVAAVAVLGPAAPDIPGVDVSVAVHRESGEIAVLRDQVLVVVRGAEASEPVMLSLPGGRLLEFRGTTILVEFPAIGGRSAVRAALSPRGRERLAWPNPGVGEYFPDLSTRLTLDGRGLHGDLQLTAAVRRDLGGLDGIPDGAGVVASYRFRGGVVQARASSTFGTSVALTPDDFVISLRDGGVLRYRAPDGVLWSVASPPGGVWRVVDVDAVGQRVLVDRAGEWVGLELETGRESWRLGGESLQRAVRSFGEAAGVSVTGPEGTVRDGRLLRDGRVLVHGGSAADWVGVLDPGRGELEPAELLTSLQGPAWTPIRDFWRERRLRLEAVLEVPRPEGSVLLLRGPDGWYRVPVPGGDPPAVTRSGEER